MYLSGRIICFKTAIKNDVALLGAMRLDPLQRYYYARHGEDYTFAADYNLPRLKQYFTGQMCEFIEITALQAEPYAAIKKTLGALSDALAVKTGLHPDFLRQDGVSGRIYRAFINNYFKLFPGSRYLELGAHDGTAFLAALWKNSLEALAVDDWSVKAESRRLFMNNLLCINAPAARFGMLDKNLGEIFPQTLGPRDALFCFRNCMPSSALLDEVLVCKPERPALLAVDAWNFGPRREDWLSAIEDSAFEPVLTISVRTSLDDTQYVSIEATRWNNGYFIALLGPKEGAA